MSARSERGFKTFGPEVEARHVARLVRAGRRVWSYGYGEDDGDGFTTIEESDLWAFEGPDANPDVVASWAPFRVEMADYSARLEWF